jgi:hypothetical protein
VTSARTVGRRRTGLNAGVAKLGHRVGETGWLLETGFGDTRGRGAEVEYTALVSVKVNLGTGEVASVDIRPPGDGDEVPAEVGVSLDSETDQPDEVFDLAQ